MRGDEPDGKGDGRKGQHDGHKDCAGAVGQPLHGRARRLRLLNHAGDLRQHRGLAQRLGTASDRAVVVERAGQHAAAGLARQRSGFAGEHRFVYRGAAFQNGCVHGEALAGKNQNAVAGLNLFERHYGFDAVADAAGSGGAQAGERIERSQGAAFGSGFERLTQQEKSENQQDRVEIDLAAGRGPDGGISGIEQSHARSQTHQGIHVGVSVAECSDGAQVNAASGPDHDNRCENQQRPAQRLRRKRIEPGKNAHESVVQCTHFGSQRHGQQHRGSSGDECDRSFPTNAGCVAILGGLRRRSIGTGKNRVVAGRANGGEQRCGRGDSRIEDHDGAIGHQIDARGFHSGG